MHSVAIAQREAALKSRLLGVFKQTQAEREDSETGRCKFLGASLHLCSSCLVKLGNWQSISTSLAILLPVFSARE